MIDKKDKNKTLKIMANPTAYGYKNCHKCDGHGSLSRTEAIHEICPVCGGDGVLKNEIS